MTKYIEVKEDSDRSRLFVMELAHSFGKCTGIAARRPVSPTGEYLARCCFIERKNDV